MNTSSAKSKGRRLQQYVRDKILALFPELTESEVRSTAMGQSGADILLSEKAKSLFPFNVEAKNQESLSIWKALEQSERDRKEGSVPLLVFKRNRSDVYCALKFEDFMSLIRKETPNE